jgi:putative membrane protein
MSTPAPDVEHEAPVDYRFILANERTFLAWMRTALGMVAGGVALHQFVTVEKDEFLLPAISIVTILLGALVALTGTVRWVRMDSAMRTGRPVRPSRFTVALGALFVLLALAVGLLLWRT